VIGMSGFAAISRRRLSSERALIVSTDRVGEGDS
jgi:hypothetical protein